MAAMVDTNIVYFAVSRTLDENFSGIAGNKWFSKIVFSMIS